MGTNLSKTEKMIALSAFLAIAIFFIMFLQINQRSNAKLSSQFETTHAINYKMARPDQLYSEYTLTGRELDQSYEALSPAAKKLVKRKQALIAKQKVETKKKEELKKKLAATSQAQIQARARAQAVSRQNQMKAYQALKSSPSPKSQPAVEQDYSQNINNTGAAAPLVDPTKAVKTPGKKSFAEWRALIFEKGSSEAMGQFIAAFRKNEISATEFQVMAQDLLDQSDVKLKGLGLMALRSVPSLASLSQLVHIQASLNETYQAYVEQSLLAYFQPQNLSFLNQALGTRDKVVLLKSLTLLNANLQRLSQGDQSGFIDPRNRREDTNTSLSMLSFKVLLPTLGSIGSSQDQELASLATQVATLIQSSNTIAQSN